MTAAAPLDLARSPANDPDPDRYADEDRRWAAVLARDPAAEGAFWYAVSTTGVYCRPSCAARTPNRRNVGFYDSVEAAEAAGFRACKRCRPRGPSLAALDAETAAAACRAIEASPTPPSVAELAEAAGLSVSRFHRVFKAVTGTSPRRYATACRAGRVKDALSASPTVTDAIRGAGFGSSGRFYAQSDASIGMTPSERRAGGHGTEVRFAVADCTLGALLVACSARGVCAIALGDDPDALVRALEDELPRAALVGDDPAFADVVARVVALVEDPGAAHDLPLDLQGTAFQRRVWQALRGLPAGTTATYADIARAVGMPRGARAVAAACAANRLAVAVPCHRVVRTDGSLSGYRWGVARKSALLARERGEP